ncbi:MAG: hypothetical protein LBU39_04580 [Desulfobulbaceae bacterium]|nr:hypothetical protein [Desulfobulbaceae bacterium]
MSQKKEKGHRRRVEAEKTELAMIEGILEGSPDGIGVVVVRMQCGCRKMAAVANDGEPASKVIMYRDQADSICPQCKADNGAYQRVAEASIHWLDPPPDEERQEMIHRKVLGEG